MNGYAVVIGASNVDIGGRSFAPLREADSNPGRIICSPGGVGRNIAANLRLLGVPVKLITALGGDFWADSLREDCTAAGIDLSFSLTAQGESTPAYMFITDPDGNMRLAVSDTALLSRLSPEYLESCAGEINGADVVVFDTNIPEESINWLAKNCDAPLIADPVSAAKAEKLRDVLPRLFAMKPNILEAETLTGVCIETDYRLRKAAEALVDAGVENVFISLGADGIFAKRGDIEINVPCAAETVKDVTGGGDAAVAAITWAYLEGLGIREAAIASQEAAAMAVGFKSAINPSLSAEALRKSLENAAL